MTERAEDLAKARVADDLGAGWPSGYEAGVKAERERRSLQDERDGGWQDIATAPTESIGYFYSNVVIGFVTWGKEGRVHRHVGPIEWMNDHWEFVGLDGYDAFPLPTAWRPLPSPPHTFTPDQITETINERHEAGERA